MKCHSPREEELNKIFKRPKKWGCLDLAVPHSFRDKRGFLDTLYTEDDAKWGEWIEKNDRIVLVEQNFETICIRMGKKLLILEAFRPRDSFPMVSKEPIFSDSNIGNPIYFSHFFPDRHQVAEDAVHSRTMSHAGELQSRSSITVVNQGKTLVTFTTSYSKKEWLTHLCCSAKKWLLLQELLILNTIPSEVIHYFSYKRIWELDPVDYNF
jgi:hypothetical protein